MSERLRVLIVDDSAVCRAALRHALEADPEIEVVGEAKDGVEATGLAEELRPSLITMDLQMPRMGGLEAISWLMKNRPTPILVITDKPRLDGVDMTFASLSRGALDLLPKAPVWSPGSEQQKALVARVKELARSTEKRVVLKGEGAPRQRGSEWKPHLLAIGASTGGPTAIVTVLKALPANFPLPIIVVQHMDPLFHDSFTVWLHKQSKLPVRTPADGDPMLPGEVLVPPIGYECVVVRGGRVRLLEPKRGALHVPSVDALFESMADVLGARAIAVLLTGMGRDGATGLKSLYAEGALTLVQDRESSVVFGMPGTAVELGAAEKVLPLEEIGEAVSEAVTGSGVSAGHLSAARRGNARAKVLVVDDSQFVLEAARIALQNAGYDVVTLDNPLTLAGAIRREKPDVVLLDVKMPALPGDLAMQVVARRGFAEKTRVLLHSDLPDAELAKRARECGALGYIKKSTPAALVDAVATVLEDD